MPWYVAHAVMYFKLKHGPQDTFTIWENMILIEAPDDKTAWSKAVERGKQDETDCDGGLTTDDKPSMLVFAGIRKLLIVSHEGEEGKLSSGDELTFSEYGVNDEAAIHKFVSGEEVPLVALR
jgi:hypothetical protein